MRRERHTRSPRSYSVGPLDTVLRVEAVGRWSRAGGGGATRRSPTPFPGAGGGDVCGAPSPCGWQEVSPGGHTGAMRHGLFLPGSARQRMPGGRANRRGTSSWRPAADCRRRRRRRAGAAPPASGGGRPAAAWRARAPLWQRGPGGPERGGTSQWPSQTVNAGSYGCLAGAKRKDKRRTLVVRRLCWRDLDGRNGIERVRGFMFKRWVRHLHQNKRLADECCDHPPRGWGGKGLTFACY